MCVCVCVCLSVCLPVCVFAYLNVCLCACLQDMFGFNSVYMIINYADLFHVCLFRQLSDEQAGALF